MASLSSIYVSAAHLRRMLEMCESGNRKGVELTIAINDAGNNYGKNVDVFIAQTADQRSAKEKKDYVGSGNCFWTNGKITQLNYAPDGAPPAEPKTYAGVLVANAVIQANTPQMTSASPASCDVDLPF